MSQIPHCATTKAYILAFNGPVALVYTLGPPDHDTMGKLLPEKCLKQKSNWYNFECSREKVNIHGNPHNPCVETIRPFGNMYRTQREPNSSENVEDATEVKVGVCI